MQRNQEQKQSKQSLSVYCRLRPVSNPIEPICMTVSPPSLVHMVPPSTSVQHRNGVPLKEMQFTFKKVFDDKVNQKEVFRTVALPLVENLLNGGNGLLFTYGVTGSGKTFTMNGTGKDGGIMPRCIDTIFNSIGPYKAGKYMFKPDRLNGFDIQGEADALLERQQDFLSVLTPAKKKPGKLERNFSNPDFANRIPDDTKINNIMEDNTYSVFVTFVEIYNNSVYDLLDESFVDGQRGTKTPQVKIIREDADHNMFVHGVNEVEVTSAKEAFHAFYSGQKRRRIAHTALNAESSRAHTIFTIRVVQAPINDNGEVIVEKKYMQVSQLSLVDLAGSERTNRTKNTGQRLREAGNINNSLMTLRSCLEILRENQKGANKMVPYRDSRLTHLFKSFFEGEGLVAMVVCVNPRAEDYDENLQVMKFAEISQEIQIVCPTPKVNLPYTPRKRKINSNLNRKILDDDDKENKDSPTDDSPKACSIFSDIPSAGYISPEDEENHLLNAVSYLESQLKLFESFSSALTQKGNNLHDSIAKMDKKTFMSAQEIKTLNTLCDREKARVSELEARIKNSDAQVTSYKRKVDEYEMDVKRLKRELTEKEILISKHRIDNHKVKEHFNNKIAQTEEKLKSEMERKLRSQKSALEFELRSRDRKLREAKRVLSDEALPPPASMTPRPERPRPAVGPWTPLTARPPSPDFRSTGRKLVTSKRMRRSKSAETWLEHKPPAPTDLPTVLQPVMTRRRSVSKLTDAKDLLSAGADRYCLVTQGQDSDGDLEARIYKGDIVPTTGGGAQVMFSDVEILKQKSPTTPRRRNPDPKNVEQACSVAIEGHRQWR